MPLSTLCLANLPTHAAGGGADGDRAEQRRREEADDDADAAAPAQALAAEVVAGLADLDLAVGVVRDEDHALGPDLLVLDELHEPVEVLLGRLDGRVAGHDDVEGVAHRSSPSVGSYRPVTPKGIVGARSAGVDAAAVATGRRRRMRAPPVLTRVTRW